MVTSDGTGTGFGPTSAAYGSGPYEGLTRMVLGASAEERMSLMHDRPQREPGPWEGHALDMPTHTFDNAMRELPSKTVTKVIMRTTSRLERVISRVLLPLTALPESGIVRHRRLIAHSASLVPLPPLGVPPTMDQTYAEWQQAADTWGIGYQSEGRFLESPIGILWYLAAVRRISEALLDNIDRKGMLELLASDYHPMFDKTEFGKGKDKLQLSLQADTFEGMLNSVFQNWNILNRRADGAFLEVITSMREQLEARGVRPNALVVPAGTLAVMRLKNDALRVDAFDDGQAMLARLGMITTASGMAVLQSPKMRLAGAPEYVDMMVQDRTVGEFHPMCNDDNCKNVSREDYKTWMRTIKILDHSGNGTMMPVTLEEAFQHSHIYENQESGIDGNVRGLTAIGRALFGDSETLGQYIDSIPQKSRQQYVEALDFLENAGGGAVPATGGRRGGAALQPPRRAVRTGGPFITEDDKKASVAIPDDMKDKPAAFKNMVDRVNYALPGLYAAAARLGLTKSLTPFAVYGSNKANGTNNAWGERVIEALKAATDDNDSQAAAVIIKAASLSTNVLNKALISPKDTEVDGDAVGNWLTAALRGSGSGAGVDEKDQAAADAPRAGFGGAAPASAAAAAGAAAGSAAGAAAGSAAGVSAEEKYRRAGGSAGGGGWRDRPLEDCYRTFMLLIRRDLKFPIGFLLDRSITHKLGSMLAMRAGRETGETFAGAANTQQGNDPQSRFDYLRVQFDTLATLYAPENIVHRRNVSCKGYVRGGKVAFWKERERQVRMQPQPTGDPGGITVYPLRAYEEVKFLFDNSGEYGGDVKEYTKGMADQLYPIPKTARAVAELWYNATAMAAFDQEFHAMHGRPAAINSLTIRGPTYFPDKLKDGEEFVMAGGGGGRGHWGPDAYDGIGRLRLGLDGGVPSRLGGQQVFVSAGGAFNSNYA